MRVLISLTILGLLLAMSLAAPLLPTKNPQRTDLSHALEAPSADHPLGTDALGRDVFSRLLYGGRLTLFMAFLAAGVAVVGGLALGMSALLHPILNQGVGVLMDAWLALPPLLIALVMLTLFGQRRESVILAVGLAQIGVFARTTYDALHAANGQPYVEGARAIGASRPYIMLHHLLRNAAPLLLSFSAVIFSWALLNSAALAFLGFTGDISAPHWGVMLANGRASFAVQPWEALAAGAALTLTVGAVNQLTR